LAGFKKKAGFGRQSEKNQLHTNRRAEEVTDSELKRLIEDRENQDELFAFADAVRRKNFGTEVQLRGLVEITNYCKNNCYYCGIRKDNAHIERYRLTKDIITECCKKGYASGLRTFVLQGGEDSCFTDSRICEIIASIKESCPGCIVTLSIGEKSYESYLAYKNAGADRFLLRHETADAGLYSLLHPKSMSFEHRRQCLRDLKSIGFGVGSGFMIGAPFQTAEHIVRDFRFLQELKPDMIGVGPYITQKDTPLCMHKSGSLDLSLRVLALLRIMFPKALIPATTALGTVAENGRERGLKAGANVIMHNISPLEFRRQYALYDGKSPL
jgi:biotin synthase